MSGMSDFHVIKRKATDHPAALPHGPITPLFPNSQTQTVYIVRGCVKFGRFSFTRNMTINIHPITREITLINSVRLSETSLKELESMGQIKHVIRLCCFHGMDDSFYTIRYQAKLWALKGMSFPSGLEPDYYMSDLPNSSMPPLPIYPSGSIFTFHHVEPHLPEANLIIHHSLSSSESSSSSEQKTNKTNILISGDSIQNYHYGYDPQTSLFLSLTMPLAGFAGTCVGPAWFTTALKSAKPSQRREDFDRLLAFRCDHLVPPHGFPLLDTADAAVQKAVNKILTPRSTTNKVILAATAVLVGYGAYYFWRNKH